jgi:hypothetical protein
MTIALRKRLYSDELAILAQVAAHNRDGYLIEVKHTLPLHDYLVEDGYLTREPAQGTSRTYWNYKLTNIGRAALALRAPTELTQAERRTFADRIEDGEWPA